MKYVGVNFLFFDFYHLTLLNDIQILKLLDFFQLFVHHQFSDCFIFLPAVASD